MNELQQQPVVPPGFWRGIRYAAGIYAAVAALVCVVVWWHLIVSVLFVSPVLWAAHRARRRRRLRRFRRASLPEWIQAAAVAGVALRRGGVR